MLLSMYNSNEDIFKGFVTTRLNSQFTETKDFCGPGTGNYSYDIGVHEIFTCLSKEVGLTHYELSQYKCLLP